MGNRDRNQDEGGRKDRQPGSGDDDRDIGNPDPRRMREREEHSRDPGQNRPKERPDQMPKR